MNKYEIIYVIDKLLNIKAMRKNCNYFFNKDNKNSIVFPVLLKKDLITENQQVSFYIDKKISQMELGISMKFFTIKYEDYINYKRSKLIDEML